VAQEQHDKDCILFVNQTPLVILGANAANNVDPLSESFPQNTPVVHDIGNIADQTEIFGSSCLPPVSVTLMGHQITIPTDSYCNIAALLGNVFVSVCGIMAALIIGRMS
jgi:hypothetical protein